MVQPFSTKGRKLFLQAMKEPTRTPKPADLVTTAGWESRERKNKIKQSRATVDRWLNNDIITMSTEDHLVGMSKMRKFTNYLATMWKRKPGLNASGSSPIFQMFQ